MRCLRVEGALIISMQVWRRCRQDAGVDCRDCSDKKLKEERGEGNCDLPAELQLPLPFKVEIIIDCLEEAHTTLLEKGTSASEVHVRQGMISPRALQRLVKSRHLSSKNAGVVIMDGSFLQSYKPAIIHGYRGLSTFFAKAQAQFADLHSGYFGGVLMEPLAALVHALR